MLGTVDSDGALENSTLGELDGIVLGAWLLLVMVGGCDGTTDGMKDGALLGVVEGASDWDGVKDGKLLGTWDGSSGSSTTVHVVDEPSSSIPLPSTTSASGDDNLRKKFSWLKSSDCRKRTCSLGSNLRLASIVVPNRGFLGQAGEQVTVALHQVSIVVPSGDFWDACNVELTIFL